MWAERIGDSFTAWHWPNWTCIYFIHAACAWKRKFVQQEALPPPPVDVNYCYYYSGAAGRRVTNEKATATHLVYWVWKVSSECEWASTRALCILCSVECVEGEWWMDRRFIFKLCPIHLYMKHYGPFIYRRRKIKIKRACKRLREVKLLPPLLSNEIMSALWKLRTPNKKSFTLRRFESRLCYIVCAVIWPLFRAFCPVVTKSKNKLLLWHKSRTQKHWRARDAAKMSPFIYHAWFLGETYRKTELFAYTYYSHQNLYVEGREGKLAKDAVPVTKHKTDY